jgi:Bacterial Ig-like domain
VGLKTSHRRLAVLVASAVVAWALLVTSAAATPVTAGFRDFAYGSSASAPTADKPQSKLWFQDGRWWGVLFNSSTSRFEIYGFNLASQATNAWTSTGTVVDVRRTTQSDVRWSGTKLYVVTHLKAGSSNADPAMRVRRFGYTPGGTPGAGTYTLESSTNVSSKSVESATVDRDSTGKLWVTWTEDTTANRRAVFITHTVTTDTDFVTPYVLPAVNADNLGSDDISTLVASGGKIGVLYSNQTTAQLQLATHADANGDDRAWTTTSLCSTASCPDDHLNIKDLDGANGQAFAVVKTSFNDTGGPGSAPLIVLYRIDMGTLAFSSHTVWTVANDVTRAITVLDKGAGDVYVFGAAPCCSGGIVYFKRSAIASPSFTTGLGTPFIQSAQDPKINNATSTKQSVDSTTGLLVVAGDDSTRFYLHNFVSLGGGGGGGDTTPPTVTATSPADGATGVAVGSDVTATFSEPMDAATVPGAMTLTAGGASVPADVTYDAATRRATLNPSGDLAPGTTYTARVSGAKDLAGNTVVEKTWSFTTASSGGSTGITRETVSTAVTTTAAASITITKPTGTVAGDVLVACLALNGSQVAAGGVPAGWSPIASNVAIANPHVFGYYRVAGSAEPADYRWTLSASVTSGAGIARYSGVSASTPLDGAASSASGAAASTATVPGVTTATAGAMLVGCMAMNSSSTTNTITSPAGMTEAWDIGGKRHELADGVQATAGASGAKSWTFSAAREWAGWLAALRPG